MTASKARLKPGGYATFQTGVPFYQPWEITEALKDLARFFPRSGLYLSVVPTYIGGFMALSWATKGGKRLGTPAGIRKAKAAYRRLKLKTDYYNPEIHAAAFALPNWIKKLVPDVKGAQGTSLNGRMRVKRDSRARLGIVEL